MRVHNQKTKGSVKGGSHLGYRCTVCGKSVSTAAPKRIEEVQPITKRKEEKVVKTKVKKVEERKKIR
jgi:hypothetical protein